MRNAERLPALQALFDEFGVRPTYLVTWEMATRAGERGRPARRSAQTGRCEIGTHLHPVELAALPSRGPRRAHLSAQPAARPARPPAHAS